MTNTSQTSTREQGLAQYRAGRYQTALQTFEALRAQAESAHDALSLAEATNDLGVTYQALKQNDSAKKNLESAMAQFAALNDDVKRAQAMGNLGTLLAEMGKYRESEIRLEQAAEIFHKAGDAQNEALTLKWLSRTHLKHWDFLGAIFAYDRALARLEPLPVDQQMLRRILQIPLRIMMRN